MVEAEKINPDLAPGEEVVALLSVEEDTVYSFGEGVYAGKFPLPSDALGFNFGQNNPKIDLTTGEIVWGCECWWGRKSEILNMFPTEKFKWEQVSIDELRRGGDFSSLE
jgi:hypothetical protein